MTPVVPTRAQLEAARILVVGDSMLDRYWFGAVERISPEAPVPIVHVSRSEERPGGAANVARNAASLGADVTLLSVVGDDEPIAMTERPEYQAMFETRDAKKLLTIAVEVSVALYRRMEPLIPTIRARTPPAL